MEALMKKREKIMEYVFLLAAVISIVAVALICIFLFANGIPAMKKIGFVEFLTGTKWKPGNNKFGIFPMILGSIYVTGGALIIGVPVGVLTSIFMARFCPEGLYKLLKPVVNLLAGIPSIVYGFFGLVVLVPFIREHFKNSNGQSILCASILLGIMILPTIIGASEPTIRAVEQSYYEGALALGATHERSVFTVVVPAAKSGILAAVILGVGRALGETMAVMMVAGNVANMPKLLGSVRFLTTAVASEMSYSSGLQRQALFSIALVLFLFIMLINAALNFFLKGRGEK